MGSEAYLVRIVALWGRVIKYVNQEERLYNIIPPWTSESEFARLSSQLQEWIDELPYRLKYSSSNLDDQIEDSQASSFVLMHIVYHTIVCILHRFSVPSVNMIAKPRADKAFLSSLDPPSDFLERSVNTCFKHAKAISIIMTEIISRSDCIVTAPFLGFAIFTASLFHLHQAFTPFPYIDETSEVAQEYFVTGIVILNKLRIRWEPLETLYKRIRILWQAKVNKAQMTAEPAAAFEGQSQQRFSGNTPISAHHSPNPAERFDIIPFPGGNFGPNFIDLNLYSSMDGDSFGDTMLDNIQPKDCARQWRTSRKYPHDDNVSETEEAADLLVYFHEKSRSGN